MDDVAAGGLAYAVNDFEGACRHWEVAFRELRSAGLRRPAVRVAAFLAEAHGSALGNRAAGQGWLQRGRRLLAAEGRCVEEGWLDLAFVACEARDLVELEARAANALELAAEFHDADLEVRALADSGYALVSQGRTAEGFARLDEAMAALVAGDVTDPAAAGMAYCAMLSACDQAGSLRRAEEWTRLAQAFLDRNGGLPQVLHTHCRLAYGSVLCSIGRWGDGEAELLEALAPTGAASDLHRADAALRLAHLRVLQGRVDEASTLLAPHEDRPAAALPLALVHLARGELDVAAAVLQRGLEAVVGDRLREGNLLAALVEVELRRDLDAAAGVAERLAEVAGACDVPALCAQAGLARARVLAARSEPAAAATVLADALRELGDDDRPLMRGALAYERAAALAAAGDTAAAVTEARAALALFEGLGAQPDADRTAALLRSLGAARPRPRSTADVLTAREQDVLDLLRQGLTNAEIGGRLYISPKTAEHHVGRVLAKLGVRSRAEAAAVAAMGVRDPGTPR
jgi:DNA-binding NarL/FixJ family response regulator